MFINNRKNRDEQYDHLQSESEDNKDVILSSAIKLIEFAQILTCNKIKTFSNKRHKNLEKKYTYKCKLKGKFLKRIHCTFTTLWNLIQIRLFIHKFYFYSETTMHILMEKSQLFHKSSKISDILDRKCDIIFVRGKKIARQDFATMDCRYDPSVGKDEHSDVLRKNAVRTAECIQVSLYETLFSRKHTNIFR